MAASAAPPPPLPSCLLGSLFGADDSCTSPPHPATHIECVGCRLHEHLGAVDSFVEEHCTSVPPHHLFRLAADLYEFRVRPSLARATGVAPEWNHKAIARHYQTCAFTVRLTIVQKLREYREIRALLRAQLQRAAEQGAEAPETLALYARVAGREASQHAHLQSLPQPSLRVAPPPPPTPASSAPPVPPAFSLEDDAASVASAAGTEQAIARAYDARTARDALRGVLFERVEPCPAPRTAPQPTLHELSRRADAADVMAREKADQRRGFQGPTPASGRRCFCRGDGPACHVVLDAPFLEHLVGADGGLRSYYREPSALRDAILSLLELSPGPIRKRPRHRAHTVFAFRLRKAPSRPP